MPVSVVHLRFATCLSSAHKYTRQSNNNVVERYNDIPFSRYFIHARCLFDTKLSKKLLHFETWFLIKFGTCVSKIWYFFLKELCYLKIFLHYKKYKKYCTQINLFVKRNYLFLISILEIVLIKMFEFMILSPRYLFPLSIYVLN